MNISVFIGAVVAVAGLTGGTKRLADSTYVRADSFAVHQLREDRQRVVDSVIHAYEQRELAAVKADVDTIKRCLQRRKGCQ